MGNQVLSRTTPEVARFSRLEDLPDDPKVKSKKRVIAVMLDRHLYRRGLDYMRDGTTKTRMWAKVGTVPAGMTIQQYCEQLKAEGYEIDRLTG